MKSLREEAATSVRIKLKDWRGFVLVVVAASAVVLCFSIANAVTGYRRHRIAPGIALRVSNDIPRLVVARYEVDGRAYELRETHSGKGTPRKGDRLYVRYQIDSPEISRLTGASTPWLEVVAAWLGGTVLILGVAYLSYVNITERTQKEGLQNADEPP